MQKVSYMGDGETTEFFFNFPYFENSNIIVEKNGNSATGYNIIGIAGGLDADIPYNGGKIVFEVAPTEIDSITILRQLPLTRIIDYQPLAKIEPTVLNQDMNYTMEILKDLKDEFNTLCTMYHDIADKESAQILLAKINAVTQQINALGDMSQIRNNIATNADNITTLDTRTNGMLDYVIDFQIPTADNNHTWYRKYKSGWIEQGGYCDGNTDFMTHALVLPEKMSDNNYTIMAQTFDLEGAVTIGTQTQSEFTIFERVYVNSWYYHNFCGYWCVKGLMCTE